MLYFIPSWYRQEDWSENEQSWHVARTRSEFDDAVKQIQLFHRSSAYPYTILLLSYSPNFRHFLHRQSVYHAPYWSCFDAICEVKRKKAALLSFHNLNWPEGIEFVYSPLGILAMLNGRKYAQIEFGEDGNLIRIDMFHSNRLRRRNFYDDRGFVSSMIVYEAGEAVYQDYLKEDGTWKLRVYFEDGRVDINPESTGFLIQNSGQEYTKNFSKTQYKNLSEVIAEVFFHYVSMTKESDIFCIAMHARHALLLGNILEQRKTILSFYEDRFDFNRLAGTDMMLKKANYIITDSKESTQKILDYCNELEEKITDISPYDSRVDFGISSQLSSQKIMVPVDGLMDEEFTKIVQIIGNYLLENANAQVHLFTREADYDMQDKILEKTRTALSGVGLDTRWALVSHVMTAGENQLYEEDAPVRFFVEQCVDVLAVSKCMREQRILVDVRKIPELYLQVTAISMGIPQIVLAKTKFIEDKKNGQILKSLEDLCQSLHFYLDSLNNWNEAMVASYELGKKFSTAALIDKWKEVIKSVE